MHPRGAGERIRGSVIRTFSLFFPRFSRLPYPPSPLSLPRALPSSLYPPPSAPLFVFTRSLIRAQVRGEIFPFSPFFLATFFPPPLPLSASLLLKHLPTAAVAAARVLEFHFLGSFRSSSTEGVEGKSFDESHSRSFSR